MHDVLWRCDAPEYAIEAGMCASETAVYAGSLGWMRLLPGCRTGALNGGPRAPAVTVTRRAALL